MGPLIIIIMISSIFCCYKFNWFSILAPISHIESVTHLRESLQKTSIWKFKRFQIEVDFCIFVHILLKVVTISVVACFVGSDNEGTLVAISLAWLRINRRTQQTRERETGEHNKQQRAPITIGNSSLNRDGKSAAQRQTRERELFLFSCRLPLYNSKPVPELSKHVFEYYHFYWPFEYYHGKELSGQLITFEVPSITLFSFHDEKHQHNQSVTFRFQYFYIFYGIGSGLENI